MTSRLGIYRGDSEETQPHNRFNSRHGVHRLPRGLLQYHQERSRGDAANRAVQGRVAEAVQAELQGVQLHGAYDRGLPERGRAIMGAHARDTHWDGERSTLEKSGDKAYSDLLQAVAILQHKSVRR